MDGHAVASMDACKTHALTDAATCISIVSFYYKRFLVLQTLLITQLARYSNLLCDQTINLIMFNILHNIIDILWCNV